MNDQQKTPSTPPKAETRTERRKRITREKLLNSALDLMAQKGYEGVTVNEITEAADVGFGSFYNYFESKEAIYTELLDTLFEAFADDMEANINMLSDAAEVMSASMRYVLAKVDSDPAWGQILVRQGLSGEALTRGLGQRMIRDIQNGVTQNRFRSDDPLLTLLKVGGLMLTTISLKLNIKSDFSTYQGMAERLNMTLEGLDERAVTETLQILGLNEDEAREIATKSLPGI